MSNEQNEGLRAQDGKSHLNCWSKGETQLGRWLSNFAESPFKHPKYGHFASVEAFWYWLATGQQHNHLRRLFGASAKSAGLKLAKVEMPVEEFRQAVLEAIRCKIEQSPRGLEEFVKSTLPFEHYFVYGGKGDVIVNRFKHRWQMEFLETLRDELRTARGLPALQHPPLVELPAGEHGPAKTE